MVRVSRYSSLKNNRFQLLYTNHINNPDSVRRVEAADAARKPRNHTEHPSDHFLNFFNNYYQSIDELKQEFKNFYHNELALRKALEDLDANSDLLEINMRTLVNKFNKTLESLRALDDSLNTRHTSYVEKRIIKHLPVLQHYGIYFMENEFIDFDSQKFINKLSKASNTEIIFDPLKQVIVSIHRALYKLRIVDDHNKNSYTKNKLDTRGLYIERKL
ncbi:hypothetical protein [Desulfuribacillus alkaliarsenatis]|uniref:Uncharacterized protein n=1 Tax=Desulfuribacillus alkaliarsenatis TaxID=766136 RepID=A0A1E5G381_9FIRM|nr:hypothetical protein [Desulfuribacillus alkaliarsenatis]OEF97536.1 hypothetical protein BHF68_04840 [Desulfuribacillus alkaliarsenatis]